jgi:hypothetical protein
MADKPPQLRPWGGRKKVRHAGLILTVIFVITFLIAAALVTGITFLATYLDLRFPHTVFTVAITGVTGLDRPARDVVDPPTSPTTAISPVFNLTFQTDNKESWGFDACVPDLSTADVSYRGAFLATGSVPPLCTGENRRSDPVAARASGENVTVPKLVSDQLAAELAAGDASVDVKVTMPTYCQYQSCGGAVLSCKPKIIGGGSRTTSPAACRLEQGWSRWPKFFRSFL